MIVAEKRRADMFAGAGSLAEKLKKRRMAIEDGDPSGGQASNETNSADNVVSRGYFDNTSEYKKEKE